MSVGTCTMMRPPTSLPEVFLYSQPIDFRKGMTGLAAFVEGSLEMDPFSEKLFVFINRHHNHIKLLYWDRNGFCLWQKRLEQDRFHWWQEDGKIISSMTGQELNWLLDGCNPKEIKGHPKRTFSSIL